MTTRMPGIESRASAMKANMLVRPERAMLKTLPIGAASRQRVGRLIVIDEPSPVAFG
jgi:hypothetical protein